MKSIRSMFCKGGVVTTALIMLSLMGTLVAHAAPPLPASFYGFAQVSGADASAGATVAAWINNSKIAEAPVTMVNGRASYRIDVLGDDPDTPVVEGGVDGDLVTFTVDGALATQTAAWQLGAYTALDLSAVYAAMPPVATDQSVFTDEDSAAPITLVASDINNDALTYTVVSAPANGALSGAPPALLYTPNANFHGSDTFTFQANDGTADSNLATVTITVSPLNDTPLLPVIPNIVMEEGAVQVIAVSASDVDGDAITLSAGGLPTFATFVDNGDGTGALTLAPGYDAAGSYNLTVSASDGAASSTQGFAVTISDAAPKPSARFSADDDWNVALDDNGATARRYCCQAVIRGHFGSSLFLYLTLSASVFPSHSPCEAER